MSIRDRRDEPRHLVEVLLDQVAEAPDDPPALVRRHLGPRALVEGLASRGHREIDGFAVEHGQRAGRAQAHGAHVGVRWRAEGRAAPAEDLGICEQAGMDFEANYRFKSHEW